MNYEEGTKEQEQRAHVFYDYFKAIRAIDAYPWFYSCFLDAEELTSETVDYIFACGGSANNQRLGVNEVSDLWFLTKSFIVTLAGFPETGFCSLRRRSSVDSFQIRPYELLTKLLGPRDKGANNDTLIVELRILGEDEPVTMSADNANRKYLIEFTRQLLKDRIQA